MHVRFKPIISFKTPPKEGPINFPIKPYRVNIDPTTSFAFESSILKFSKQIFFITEIVITLEIIYVGPERIKLNTIVYIELDLKKYLLNKISYRKITIDLYYIQDHVYY